MKRILIVDGAATIRMYHRSILEDAGYDVSEAINGAKALEKALPEPFDLYIVDVNMPKLDGYGFLRQFRVEDVAQAPAIMVSTEAEEQDMLAAVLAAANCYLAKPVKPEQLLTHVRLLLGELGR